MTQLRVQSLMMSVDGYAGPDQDLEHPPGLGGEQLHECVLTTRTGRRMTGEAGTDGGFLAREARRG